MVQNCPRCGTPNPGGYRYCSNCGAQVIETDERAPQPTARPMSVSGADIPVVTDPVAASMRADLPPAASERATGQATFVPYEGDAIRQIEGQKPNNGWLVPAVIIAGAILLLLVGATVFLLLANSNRPPAPGSQIASGGLEPTPAPPAPTAIPRPTVILPPTVAPEPTIALELLVPPKAIALPCALPAGATTKEAIFYRVCRSSEEQIVAWRDLNTDVLKGSRTGGDLAENIQRVEKYKKDKQRADPVLHSLTIVGLKLDKESAFVRTSEVWSVTTFSSTNNSVLTKTGPTPYSEVYHLVKQNDKWLVDKVVFENQSSYEVRSPK